MVYPILRRRYPNQYRQAGLRDLFPRSSWPMTSNPRPRARRPSMRIVKEPTTVQSVMAYNLFVSRPSETYRNNERPQPTIEGREAVPVQKPERRIAHGAPQ